MRSRATLLAIVALVAWTVFTAYSYSNGVFSDDPTTGGDDAASGAVERALYVVGWLVIAIPLLVVAVVYRDRRSSG